MNGNKWILYVFLIFVISIKCFGDHVDGFPNEPGKEKQLALLVGTALVWNHFWSDDWGKYFDKFFKTDKKETLGVRFLNNSNKEQQGYQVYFDKLPADLLFFKQNGWWYAPDNYWDYTDERVTRKKNIKDYFDSKAKHLTEIKEFNVIFDKEILKILNFGPFNKEKKMFVEKVFLERIFTNDEIDSFKEVIDKNKKTGIVIKVGNFNFEYPIFYYYVKGLNYEDDIPYLGYVYFDPKTHEAFYDELVSSEVKPIKRKYKNVIKHIDQTGIILKYKDGRFE